MLLYNRKGEIIMIRRKLAAFMFGRYGSFGIDSLNLFLIVAGIILYIVGVIVRGRIASAVIFALQTAVYVYFLFRFLSKNFTARRKENDRFRAIFNRVKGWFRLQKNKYRDRGEFVYKKCPGCGAVLRLPYSKGRHTVKCPKCSDRFEVKN